MAGKPRKGGPQNQRGGRNKLPRSLGKVFKAIRIGLDLNQSGMRELLDKTPSDFLLPEKKGDGNPGASVSTWEKGQENNAFSVQHRYASIAGTYTGILHIVSLLYAHWRDARTEQVSATRSRLIEENNRISKGLIALSKFVDAENKRLFKLPPLQETATTTDDDELDIAQILALLDAYCSGAGTVRARKKNNSHRATSSIG